MACLVISVYLCGLRQTTIAADRESHSSVPAYRPIHRQATELSRNWVWWGLFNIGV